MTAKAQTIDPATVKPVSKIKILGNVYGGGDQAAVQGNTNVEINKGQFAGDIFGGGNGALNTDGTVKSSADIGTHNADGTLKEGTGQTKVTINGGEILYDDVVALDGEGHVQKDAEGNIVYTYKNPSNHNVYGGGNQACNVAGDTHVEMKKGMISLFTFFSNRDAATDLWQHWYDQAMNPNTQKKPIASVFGAGYGAHTDVAGSTNVTINIPGTTAIHPANGIAFTHTELENIDKIIQRWQPDPRVAEQFVTAVHGGGYDGTVGAYDPTTGGIKYDKTSYLSQTNVSITGQPFIFHVYGGGLGSKAGADANGNVNSHVGAVYGATKVDIQGGIINGDVFGGGAGIAGQATIPNPFPGAMGGSTVNLPYTYAAQVMRETDVTINGNSTVIFGNVYGGGDIANTGWHTTGARPTMTGHVEQKNTSLATLDYTTSLHLNGGNILGKVFGGGNGRKKDEVEQYKFIGAVIGSTNVEVNGSTIWGDIYGGGNTGCIYSCQTIAGTQGAEGRAMVNGVLDGSTNVQILDGKVARDIFGGGYGDDPNLGDEAQASSADIYGNAFVFFKKADLEYEKYWKPREIATNDNMGSSTEPEVTGRFLAQRSGYDAENNINYRNSESDITHNLYGGGNMACTIFGNTHVYMSGAPTAPANFSSTDYYKECIDNVAKPHFSVFGGGFGSLAKVSHNAYSDINLAMGTGLHSIIGGGMNGPVVGSCQVHVGNDPQSLVHHVYGGGYYAPCHDTELEITRGTILENVFGGSVMGNIWAENDDMTKVVTKTVIGLKSSGEHSTVKLEDEKGNILRQYTYENHKNQITIGGNVYGANDVSGTVNGVASLTIYGGTIKGDVFGAGNGDHIGYYVPNELRYDLGAHGIDNYFPVVHHEPGAPNGNTYVGRPQTIGGVELTLEGNTTDERVTVLGQVFGGGNSCTIGAWNKTLLTSTYFSNPHLVRDDPAYFLGGGKIDVNLGSHITIGRSHAQLDVAPDKENYLIDGENVSGLYMGCSGRHLATQNWAKTDNYYHHYYDASTAKYWPGFAVYQDNSETPLTRQEGLQSFLAYMNNILVWSNEVHLNVKNGAEDIWLSNFVGGGFRGSMKVKDQQGEFRYTLPRGVTIGHDVIGGAYNTDVVYRIFETTDGHTYTEEGGHYKYLTTVGSMTQADEGNTTGDYHHIEYAENGTDVTGIVRFYYNGGMLSELPYGTDKSTNQRVNRILKEYSDAAGLLPENDVNKDFAGERKSDGTLSDVRFNKYKEGALVYLDLNNKFETEYVNDHVHGGNVFGGCFASGRVEGDIWTDYRCYQEGAQAQSNDFNLSDQNFNKAKDFENNFAMMLFGAGYGANTTIQGSAYVRVLHQDANPSTPGRAYGYPRLYNVFGGSYEGKVEGNTNIYFNPGKYGYVAGAIYGGGCNGYVGGKTYLELAGGYIDEAYGGAKNANIGGGTHIWAYDGKERWWGELPKYDNWTTALPSTDTYSENAQIFIGKLYGGTDVSGQICTDEKGNYNASKGYQPFFSAKDWPEELTTDGEYNAESISNQTYINTYLQVGGINRSERGYPVIGQVFAGGNGEATDVAHGQTLPDLRTTLLEINDGSIVYAFGGGNHATVTEQNYIMTNCKQGNVHDLSGLGGIIYDVVKKRILNVAVDCYTEQTDESGTKQLKMYDANVQRLFGGNNVADMAIQPKWHLIDGYLTNVYSGGNMGRMTWFRETDATPANSSSVVINDSEPNSNLTPQGLQINIDQPNIHIGSLFGGCRMADVIPGGFDTDGVTPLKKDYFEGASKEDFYGATVNISDGYIENVYGGNDVSGTVYYGTNVNISGAVSGNVYGSGNGFYQYKWDKEFAWNDPEKNPNGSSVVEDIDAENKLYYHVKPFGDLSDTTYGGEGANDTQKLLTINHYRPSVEKAFLNIAGIAPKAAEDGKPAIAKRVAYVKGNVYCGGNASTVLGAGATDNSYTKFKIGSYVTLNGVFMGSDGAAFSEDAYIRKFETMNGIQMASATDETAIGGAGEKKFYPNLLSVYMKAVEMKAQPKEFNLNLPLKEAHIGTYCGGGNRGSMTVNETVNLTFHHDLVIYDKIVAACLNSNVAYKKDESTTVKAWGGYLRPIADDKRSTCGNTKMNLTIASQFAPLEMDVPADKVETTKNKHGETFAQAQAHDFLYARMDVDNAANVFSTSSRYGVGCNIYGGCYSTGEVEGDVILNIHSNMLRYANKAKYEKSVADNIACFNVYGAGYGLDSHVWGNVNILMNRRLAGTSTDPDPIMGTNNITLNDEIISQLGTASAWNIQHADAENVLMKDFGAITDVANYPSVGSLFGGGRSGMLIGNAEIQIRNGLVYRDVTGGSYAADMYGSSQVIVGYPKYYRCQTSAMYHLERGDKWNLDKQLDASGNNPVLKQNVHYMQGDLVPANVYDQIYAHDASKASSSFTLVEDDFPASAPWNTTWDDIKIKIGGGVYGGGFSLTNSMSALAGSISTHKLSATEKIANYYDPNRYLNFNGRYGLDIASTGTAGYGGNSSVMIGDNTDQINAGTKDHVRISTLQAEVAKFNVDDWVESTATDTEKADTENHNSVIGKFTYDEGTGKYTHLGDGRPIKGTTYYTLSGEGGIYGDGHLVFCEGFRAADITGYGYAEGSPKHPILMNTFQRLDLVTMNDCCLMLQGAQDFATNQTDATVYSIARIDELRMNSSIDPTQTLKCLSNVDGTNEMDFDTKRVRNYLGFFNNVHFLGSIITNDPFQQTASEGAIFHGIDGDIETGKTYYQKKQDFIETYSRATDKTVASVKEEFKKRNTGTARNAIGINNGYCLRIQNQCFREGEAVAGSTYYGPIVGVCEVKLLTLVEGEGGGYVYADNVHNEWADDYHQGHDFLNVSGNFVFPGIVHSTAADGAQYIVDDCFTVHYGTNADQTTGSPDQVVTVNGRQTNKKEAHYWFVEGNKYFFHTTLTGYTFTAHNNFDLIDNDANILLSGLDSGYNLQVKSVNWGASVHRDDYVDDLVANYTDTGRDSQNLVEALTPADGYTTSNDPYHFNMQVGRYKDVNEVLHNVWSDNMPRYTTSTEGSSIGYTIPTGHEDVMPVFNVTLSDNVDNAPLNHEEEYYNAHLNEPDVVKIVLSAKHPTDPSAIEYTYTITMNVVYMQGPSFTGGPVIENCILPGEILKFSSEGVHVHTTDQLPLTSYGWKIVKPVANLEGEGVKWQTDEISGSANNPIPLDPSLYNLVGEHLEGHMKGYYYQNGWNIAYIFTAGGHDFAVLPIQDPSVDASKRMFVVHNYQRMYKEKDLEVPMAADARVYIEDEKDMRAFLNQLQNYDFAKQRVFMMADFDLTSNAYSGYNLSVLKNFKGVFDGYGHSLTVPTLQTTASTTMGHNDASIRTIFEEAIGLTGQPTITKYTQTECDAYNNPNLINDKNGVAPGGTDYITTYREGFIPRTTNDEKVRIGSVVNLLVLDGSADESEGDYKYGKMAYELNKFYLDRREKSFDNTNSYTRKYDYVEEYFKNGDYQYAGIKYPGNPFLRTGENNYDSEVTHHDASHAHDKRRWNGDHNVPLYEVDYATLDTYDANNHGDFNDYIYFGQKIANRATAGNYELGQQRPYAIKKNEADVLYNGANFNNMNDRVFLADGYYHTKENKGFYHNVDAVVIDPYTTAVGFGEESMTMDQPEHGITSFDVDSNKDYDINGNANVNGSGNIVDEDKYSNAVTNHVTQNLLVYTNKVDNSTGLFAAGNYNQNTKESEIRYHAIANDGTNNQIANLHLVDKQDFNAPLAFNVTNRAWYERVPDRWRNVDRGYGNASAWEGICLPFTAKKVSASENGEITHFYGKDVKETVDGKDYDVSTLHHEYWLSGLVGVDNNSSTTKATFESPATTTGVGMFSDGNQEKADYTFENKYFTTLEHYNAHYDTRPNESHELEWYEKQHKYKDYVFLSKTIPYIISFPGKDFYEFDLSGQWYKDVYNQDASHNIPKSEEPQVITFENSDALNGNAFTIFVSDGEAGSHTTNVNDYEHIGTYMLKDKTEGRPADEAPSMLGSGLSMNDAGTAFEGAKVLPFRTYMKATTASPVKGGCIWINDGADYVPQIPVEEAEEGGIEQGPGMTIRVEKLHVIVNSTFEEDRRLNVYTPAGQMVMIHTAKPGRTDFYLPKSGLYIIGDKRFMVGNR